MRLLKRDQHQKALAIVRVASRDVECTVSWNHLVDYEMGNGRVASGSKLYNEVEFPNAGYSKYDLMLKTASDEETCPAA